MAIKPSNAHWSQDPKSVSEIVQQIMKREKDAIAQRNLLDAESLAKAHPVPDLEKELHEMGKTVRERVLEIMFYREKGTY